MNVLASLRWLVGIFWMVWILGLNYLHLTNLKQVGGQQQQHHNGNKQPSDGMLATATATSATSATKTVVVSTTVSSTSRISASGTKITESNIHNNHNNNNNTITNSQQQQQQQQLQQQSIKYWKEMWSQIKLPHADENSMIDLSIHNQPGSNNNKSSMSFGEFMSSFPIPTTDSGTLQIYNQESYYELIHDILTTTNNQKNFTICGMGGSSTAGGGNIGMEHVFHQKFTDYLDEFLRSVPSTTTMTTTTSTMTTMLKNRSLNVIHRGHGARRSLHSTVFAPYFFPPDTDLLFWEFSINDFGYNIKHKRRKDQERSMMIDWLLEVERMEQQQPTPPKVILVYLWKSPAFTGKQRRVNDGVFQSHVGLSERFKFIVGHVNVVSYLREPHFTPERRNILLQDYHHPNAAGHAVITFLIFYLLRGEPITTTTTTTTTTTNTTTTTTLFVNDNNDNIINVTNEVVRRADRWFCGNDTEDKRLIKSIVAGNDDDELAWDAPSPRPKRAFTLEFPQNVNVDVKKKLILSGSSSNHNNTITLHAVGKQSPKRIDRQQAIAISCCNTQQNHSTVVPPSYYYTKFQVPPAEDDDASSSSPQSIDSMHAIFFGLETSHNGYADMHLFVNDGNGNKRVNGRPIFPKNMKKWPCFWSWNGIYSPSWYVLDTPAYNVTDFQVCVESVACTDDNDRRAATAVATTSHDSKALLISLLVY